MILYEIFKYWTIELVVGLEIDQIITIFRFNNFGTQLYLDNSRIEW